MPDCAYEMLLPAAVLARESSVKGPGLRFKVQLIATPQSERVIAHLTELRTGCTVRSLVHSVIFA